MSVLWEGLVCGLWRIWRVNDPSDETLGFEAVDVPRSVNSISARNRVDLLGCLCAHRCIALNDCNDALLFK